MSRTCFRADVFYYEPSGTWTCGNCGTSGLPAPHGDKETGPPSLSADAGASYQRAAGSHRNQSARPVEPNEHTTIPRTYLGQRLHYHLTAPELFGWPTDDQLAASIIEIEEQLPQHSDVRINRDGVFMSFGCFFIPTILMIGYALWIAWPR